MTVKIITDGSADLPKHIINEFNISIVPLRVHFQDEEMDSTTNIAVYYEKMKTADQLPTTSSPSPHQFYEAITGAEDAEGVIVITCSANLSSTYQHALMAKDMIQQESRKANIAIIDSKTASMGLGLIAYKAAKWAKEELDFKQTLEKVIKQVEQSKTYFVLDTLENVIKGGRLDKMRGKFASLLNIKLLMMASPEGTIQIEDKLRGSQKALKKMVEKISEVKQEFNSSILSVTHYNCESRAKKVIEMILEKHAFQEVIISPMGPVIGTYGGEGAIMVTC
ncbi:DegV family protein [Longirhabdus pacifica]|uniref:DegV family protein n=1 Tax=Longirhabdus pacifica TaxID=2305227 RepID=UPI0013E8CC3F|nr:DegV family protein [Longirhabdus pacifica]